ncbi:MAG: carboxypeptidase-like regulatory domain-containing protein [Acidimicrobiales bacterium]
MSARPRARRRTAAATALALLGGIATLVTTDADRALAVVEHRSGFDATVLGWTSWYGSYGLGDQGLGWCIDHGLLAPDAAYGYVPVAPPMDERTGAAVSWVVATGELADRTGAAAIMLVLHDLMGATYPFGRLDVDAMGPANLGGFGGAEAAVLDRARALKRWGLAHADLRGPYRIDLDADAVAPGVAGEVRGALVDRDGRPIGGVVVALAASGHLQDRTVVTDDAGRFRTTAQAIEGPNAFLARATLPSPTPRILAPAAPQLASPSPASPMRWVAPAFSLPPSTTTTRPPTTSTPTTSTPTTFDTHDEHGPQHHDVDHPPPVHDEHRPQHDDVDHRPAVDDEQRPQHDDEHRPHVLRPARRQLATRHRAATAGRAAATRHRVVQRALGADRARARHQRRCGRVDSAATDGRWRRRPTV